jgi:hypothetical protein
MAEEITLTQLAAEIAQLRRQIETMNQRLDMIYGAVTRLADQMTPTETPPPRPTKTPQPGPELSATAMMDPGGMLDALHQYAVKAGLDISQETVERLKRGERTEEATGEK